MEKTVCVTGAAGFIASWIVKLLLDRGYTVHATVRNLRDPSKVAHLKALEGASERLKFYEADLLVEGSVDSAVDGCVGVFHTASPLIVSPSDPQVEMVDAAVNGTLNVLKSCAKVSTIKRVVITSSIGSVMYNYDSLKPDIFVDETWFSDPDFCRENKEWYLLSKTLAERAAWKFAEEHGLDMVTLHPGYTIGPPLPQQNLNLSVMGLLNLIKDGQDFLHEGTYYFVDVRDVALAHVLAFENTSASGRYLLVGRVAFSYEAFDILKSIFPSLNLPPKAKDKTKLPFQVSKERAESLGIRFRPLEETLKDTVQSFRDRNLITF